MADYYYGSICLSDIPRELIRTANNGKKYLSITVAERRQVDNYGNTHYIVAYVRKDQQVPEGANLYIGELKTSTPLPAQAPAPTYAPAYAPAPAPAPAPVNNYTNEPVEGDLPF